MGLFKKISDFMNPPKTVWKVRYIKDGNDDQEISYIYAVDKVSVIVKIQKTEGCGIMVVSCEDMAK